MSHLQPAALDADSQRGAFGEGLRVQFDCPSCGDHGWIEWRNLRRGMHCRKCGCRFLIDRDGRLAARELAALPYRCPRCGRAGRMPWAAMISGVECGGCSLPLVRGPDNRLYSLDELPQAKRQAAAPDPPPGPWQPTKGRAASRWRRVSIAAISGASLLLIAGSVWYATSDGHEPGARAGELTAHCLAGDRRAAARYLVASPEQPPEFERWRIRYFASIEARFRPASDKPTVEVQVLQSDATTASVRVNITSSFFGRRSFVQRWRQIDDAWLFDAAATLAEQDRAPPLPQAAAPEEAPMVTSR